MWVVDPEEGESFDVADTSESASIDAGATPKMGVRRRVFRIVFIINFTTPVLPGSGSKGMISDRQCSHSWERLSDEHPYYVITLVV